MENTIDQFTKRYPTKEISYDDKTWTYISTGNKNGPPVFLLHGGFVDAVMWAFQIQDLESDFRIIVPNFPFPPDSFQLHCNLIKHIMEIEGIESATICGISYGGFISQYFAQYYPERVSRLIISHNTKPDSLFVRRMKMKALILGAIPNSLFKKRFKDRLEEGNDSEWIEYRKYYFSNMFGQYSKRDFIEGFKTMARNISMDPLDYSKWKGETVLLSSQDDKDVRAYLDDLQCAYPQAAHHEFQKGGHHTPLLYPEEYSQVLKEHIY